MCDSAIIWEITAQPIFKQYKHLDKYKKNEQFDSKEKKVVL